MFIGVPLTLPLVQDDWDANDVLPEDGGGGRRGGAMMSKSTGGKGRGGGRRGGADVDDGTFSGNGESFLRPSRLREMETEMIKRIDGLKRDSDAKIDKLRDTTHDQSEQIDKLKRKLIYQSGEMNKLNHKLTLEKKVFKEFKEDAARAADHEQEYLKGLLEEGFKKFADPIHKRSIKKFFGNKMGGKGKGGGYGGQ